MNLISEHKIEPGKRYLVRCDLDIPLESVFSSNYRLLSNLETLKLIINHGAIPLILGHLGRPDGKDVNQLSTLILHSFFNEELGEGNYELLENTRFDSREKQNEASLAQEWANVADFYVNECFATSHREHSSIVGITKLLPSFAGIHLEAEVQNLSRLKSEGEKPLVAIIGGGKIESKKAALQKLSEMSEYVLLGGKVGFDVTENELSWGNLIIPTDYVDTKDIGPETIKAYKKILNNAKTVVWAGPLGMYEDDRYIKATKEVAEFIINSDIYSIVGGGDTTEALQTLGLLNKIDFVSTGGSAMLEYIAKGTLPGIEVL